MMFVLFHDTAVLAYLAVCNNKYSQQLGGRISSLSSSMSVSTFLPNAKHPTVGQASRRTDKRTAMAKAKATTSVNNNNNKFSYLALAKYEFI